MAGGTAIKLKKPSPLLVVSRVALLDWLMRVILAPGTRASAISRTVPDIVAVFCAAATDADGHFRVEKVVPGRYRIFLEKAGLVGVNERGLKSDVNVVTVQAGQSVEDLLFRMLPTAVISGRVTDEDGDPMFGVRVIALRRKPGKAAREAMGSGATNDIGEYRLAGLFPGQYSIMAMPPPDFRDYEKQQEKSPPSANPGDAQPDTRYVSTYYPGTYDAVQASVLTLKAGDEMPVNFTLGSQRCCVERIETTRSLARDFSSSRRAPPKAASKPWRSRACLRAWVFMMSVCIAAPCTNGLMPIAMPSGLTCTINSRPKRRAV